MNVGVNRERGYIKGLGHHDRGRFMAHARKGFKVFKRCRDLATVPLSAAYRAFAGDTTDSYMRSSCAPASPSE